jgi:hypothetical protein
MAAQREDRYNLNKFSEFLKSEDVSIGLRFIKNSSLFLSDYSEGFEQKSEVSWRSEGSFGFAPVAESPKINADIEENCPEPQRENIC